MDVPEFLRDRFASSKAPHLFVGAGFSIRYLGSPTWRELLEKLCQDLPHDFEFYRIKSSNLYPEAASCIAEDYFAKHYAQIENDFHVATREVESAEHLLKIGAARIIASHTFDEARLGETEKKEIELFRKSVFGTVITTNYDKLVESIFCDELTRPEVFIGQNGLIAGHPEGIAELYKIHGCVTRPETMVLTHKDYDDFFQKSDYLAAKLTTLFVEQPVFFLGYSVADDNVQRILYNVYRALDGVNLDRFRENVIVFEWGPNAEAREEKGSFGYNGENVPYTKVVVPDYVGVFTYLSTLRRKFPARMLRALKENVFELVRSEDAKGQVFVTDFDPDVHTLKQCDFVIGVGVADQLGIDGVVGGVGALGIEAIDRLCICLDWFGERELNLDPNIVLTKVYPKILPNAWVPVFKYLRQAGIGSNDDLRARQLDEYGLLDRVSKNQKLATEIEAQPNALVLDPNIESDEERLRPLFQSGGKLAISSWGDIEIEENLRYVLNAASGDIAKWCPDHWRTGFFKALVYLDYRQYGWPGNVPDEKVK